MGRSIDYARLSRWHCFFFIGETSAASIVHRTFTFLLPHTRRTLVMKRHRVPTLALILVTLTALLLSAGVAAHPIAVDGAIGDWFEVTPITSPGAHPNSNTGHVARNAAQQGEFNWRDAVADQRI